MSKRARGPFSLMRQMIPIETRIAGVMAEMRRCIQENRFFNMSVPPHRETASALHWLVFEVTDANGVSRDEQFLKVEYNDGTRGQPFPVYRLWKPDGGFSWEPDEERHLRIGTLSLRHVEYDRFIDLYLIRDKETRRLTQSEVEKLAYDRTGEVLGDSFFQQTSYISIYQAGLEPLAVGMYRAITEHLIYRNQSDFPAMRIRNIFYADSETDYEQVGDIWGTM
jgi:hypothetical protein